MQKKSNNEYLNDKEARIKLMKKFHQGTAEERKEVMLYFLKNMENYLYDLVKRRYPNYLSNPTLLQDFLQAGRMAIIENLPRYDAEYKPSTYFTNHIINRMQELANNENGVNHHAGQLNTLITKGLNELDTDADTVDPRVLAIKINRSIRVTNKGLAIYRNKTRVPIIDNSQEIEDTYHTNPERLVMQQETYQLYQKAISHLLPVEQYIIRMYCGFYDKEYNPTEERYKIPQIQEIFNEKDIDVNVLNAYRIAKKNLANELRKMGFDGRKNQYVKAKEDLELKITDPEKINEMFDALNSVPLP